MRIVLLVTDHERGGTPLRLARLASGLRDAGVTVHAGCLAPGGPVTEEIAQAGIETFTCDARSPRDFGAICRFLHHMQRIKPDLIHATLTHANAVARLARLWLGIPVIGSTATIEVERRWHLTLERRTSWLDRLHIVNSAAVASHVRREFLLRSDRIRIVPPLIAQLARVNRADARRALGLSQNKFVALWYGRLDPVKRVDWLIRCAALLDPGQYHVLLAGDGPERSNLQLLLQNFTPPPPVSLLGWREDVGLLLSAADAFALTSQTEGAPNAVLEAMSLGVPVIASDIPAIREFADDERILLVGGGAAAFADALRGLRDDPARAMTLSARAAAWVQGRLDPVAAVAETMRVYEEALQISGRMNREC